MTQEDLKTKIIEILKVSGDNERAHSMEDKLHLEIIEAFCPEWVKEEVKGLSEADFSRWCA